MKTLDLVKAEGFKSIKQMQPLALRDLNVLIGANGVGKSNFLGLFKLLNQISSGNLQVYVATHGRAKAFLHFGRETTSHISVNLMFEDRTLQYLCDLEPDSDDLLIFANEAASGGSWNFHRSGQSESKLLEGKGSMGHVMDYMREWTVYQFSDTSEGAKIRLPADVDDNRALRPDGANLASILYLLKEKHPAEYTNIVESIRMVFPFFGDFTLAPLELNPATIKLEWREKGSDSYLDAVALSDGTLRFMCLATLLLQPRLPLVILVDEPELGLHPYAIRLIAELLRGAATRTQLIVATQSVTFVNQFEPEDVIVVEREDGQSVFKRCDKADLKSWLDDYSLGDLWEKNIIGGRP